MNTPPNGYPIVKLVEEMRADLKAHISKDERDTEYIRRAQDEQSHELGRQTVMLSLLLGEKQQREALDGKRAATAIELKGKTWGWVIKGALGLLFAGLSVLVGAWLHSKVGG